MSMRPRNPPAIDVVGDAFFDWQFVPPPLPEMINPHAKVFLLFCAMASSCARADSAAIQILGSWEKESLGSDNGTAVVRFGIRDISAEGGLASETTIEFASICKYSGDKPLVHENANKTIAGFTASNVRVNYKINLVWIGKDNEILVDQNLNVRIARMLTKLNPKLRSYSDGLYLDKIVDRTLYIAYDTDSHQGRFKFQIHVAEDGDLEIVPKSVKSEPLRME